MMQVLLGIAQENITQKSTFRSLSFHCAFIVLNALVGFSNSQIYDFKQMCLTILGGTLLKANHLGSNADDRSTATELANQFECYDCIAFT